MKTSLAILALALALAGPAAAADYTILVWESPDDYALRTAQTPEARAYWAAWADYAGMLTQAGATRDGAPLGMPGEARVFLGAETRAAPLDHDGLVLGGWFRIEAGSLEAASALAAQAPSVARGGAAELRTHFPAPPMTPGSAPMAAN
jgi:hypothetical protein